MVASSDPNLDTPQHRSEHLSFVSGMLCGGRVFASVLHALREPSTGLAPPAAADSVDGLAAAIASLDGIVALRAPDRVLGPALIAANARTAAFALCDSRRSKPAFGCVDLDAYAWRSPALLHTGAASVADHGLARPVADMAVSIGPAAPLDQPAAAVKRPDPIDVPTASVRCDEGSPGNVGDSVRACIEDRWSLADAHRGRGRAIDRRGARQGGAALRRWPMHVDAIRETTYPRKREKRA